MDLLPTIDRISAERRAETSASAKAEWGQYFTSSEVASFMASLLDPLPGRCVRILDPGAGTGILGAAAAMAAFSRGASTVSLVAVEAEPRTTPALWRSLDALSSGFGDRFHAEVIQEDFLDVGQPRPGQAPLPADFDIAIANPPYFKMSPTILRGGDAPNVYARFMEVAARLLRPGGLLVFIVPRSYMSGLYFKGFRRRFHEAMTLERVHVFDSRREAFREDDVLQENIIVRYRKTAPNGADIEVSASDTPSSLHLARAMRVPWALMFPGSSPTSQILLPASDSQVATVRRVQTWTENLRSLGLRISTGPVVPFRTNAMVHRPNGEAVVPLLWMQHVQPGSVRWPLGNGMRKPEYILASAGPKLLVQNGTYVLLRRFSAKEEVRRLTAAVLREGQLPGDVVGLENHLNFIHRPGGRLDPDEAVGLVTLLSSSLVDDYFRVANGNTQVNATDIEAMPLPEGGIIRWMGTRTLQRRGEDVLFPIHE